MTRITITRTAAALAAVALAAGGLTAAGAAAAPGAHAAPADGAPLTSTAHLDFLLDQATPSPVAGHTTYRLAEEPALTMPWTYADARPGGAFARVGGGPLDPVTGDWGQGAYNTDDISRAAVVYVRHWQQTGDTASRERAYELLRALAYFQTTTGDDAGNVILWMQPDGDFNESPEPVELPDPSDSGDSYWLARTLWAFGEGYAAFADEDPAFAAFLQDRLQLGVAAVDRQSLAEYPRYGTADGKRVPLWLIADGADATSEAVLGLSAYVEAAPDDAGVRDSLGKLAEGVAVMGAGSATAWPYGAVLPWSLSRSNWHAWSSQMPASLARASDALGRADLLAPAVADTAGFTPVLLTSNGPDNGWIPTPTDRVQIAYGADSRLQSLLAVADVGDRPGLLPLAGMTAAWFFGANASGEPVYDPATGVTYDGVQPDGTVNRNSGAESTIHGLLAMLALDAHPEVRAQALGSAEVVARDGLRMVEAETAASTTGTVVTPESSWTGEASISGSLLALAKGQAAVLDIGSSDRARIVEPVTLRDAGEAPISVWKAGSSPLGALTGRAAPEGVSAGTGTLLPQQLAASAPAGATTVRVTGSAGVTRLDGVLVRPVVSRLALDGVAGASELLVSGSRIRETAVVGTAGERVRVDVFGSDGRLVASATQAGGTTANVRPGGFTVVTRG